MTVQREASDEISTSSTSTDPRKSDPRNKWDTTKYFYMHSWRDDENRPMDQYDTCILRRLDEHDVIKDSYKVKDLFRHDSYVGTSRAQSKSRQHDTPFCTDRDYRFRSRNTWSTSDPCS